MEKNNLPLGLSFALAQNPEAMKTFANLPPNMQSEILERAHSVSSKEEMQSLVQDLSTRM